MPVLAKLYIYSCIACEKQGRAPVVLVWRLL